MLRNNQINPPTHGRDAGDHPPITPMAAAPREEFSKGNEWRIYDYVTRHFIASLHQDMEYVEKRLIVNLNGYRFVQLNLMIDLICVASLALLFKIKNNLGSIVNFPI